MVSLQEGVEVLAIDPDANGLRFDPDRRLFDPRVIAAICPSLVIVTGSEEERIPHLDYDSEGDSNEGSIHSGKHITKRIELRLAHFSV